LIYAKYSDAISPSYNKQLLTASQY